MSTTPLPAFVFGGSKNNGWRPPQWQKPPMVLITVPAATAVSGLDPLGQSSTGSVTTNADGGFVLKVHTSITTIPAAYVFDAVLALDHEQTLTKTVHPVQNGAAISSHAYVNPASLVLYVLMSDVTNGYTAGVNQGFSPYIQAWTGNPSRSVSAYAQMISMQAARVPLTVTTRLRTYQNMVITRVSPREDNKSITGARFRVEFEQIFVATTQAAPSSARPNDTDNTGLGPVTTKPPSNAVKKQYQHLFSTIDIPGSGTYSSVPQQSASGS